MPRSSQRISASEIVSLIRDPDEDERASELAELATNQEWDWERYATELGISDERLGVARELVNLLNQKPELVIARPAQRRSGGSDARAQVRSTSRHSAKRCDYA